MNMSLVKEKISFGLAKKLSTVNIEYLSKDLKLANLELDCIISLNFFPHIKISSKSPFGVITPKRESSKKFEAISCSIALLQEKNYYISAITHSFLDAMIFLIPAPGDNTKIFLVVFYIEEIVNRDIFNCRKLITMLKIGNQELMNLFRSNIISEIEAIATKSRLEEYCQAKNNECWAIKKQIKRQNQKIIKLEKKFQSIEAGFVDSECRICRSELKNIVFLPCGDIVICSTCLVEEFKVTPNLPISKKILKCLKCDQYVFQASIAIYS